MEKENDKPEQPEKPDDTAIQNLREKVSSLESVLCFEAEKNAQLTSALHISFQNAEERRAELASAREKLTKMEQQLRVAEQEIMAQKRFSDEIDERAAQFQSERETLRGHLSEALKRLDEAQVASMESATMQAQLSAMQTQLEERHKLLDEAAENQEKHESTRQELETCKIEFGNLKAELDAKIEELEKMKVSESEINEQIAELQSHLEYWNAQNTGLNTDIQELNTQLEGRKLELEAKMEEIRRANVLALETTKQLAELQSCSDHLETANGILGFLNQELIRKLERQKREFEEKDRKQVAELLERKEQLHTLTKSFQTEKTSSSEISTQLKTAVTRNTEQEQQLKNLERENKSHEDTIDGLTKKHHTLNKRHEELRKAMATCQEGFDWERDQMNMMLEQATLDARTFREGLRLVRNENDQLKAQKVRLEADAKHLALKGDYSFEVRDKLKRLENCTREADSMRTTLKVTNEQLQTAKAEIEKCRKELQEVRANALQFETRNRKASEDAKNWKTEKDYLTHQVKVLQERGAGLQNQRTQLDTVKGILGRSTSRTDSEKKLSRRSMSSIVTGTRAFDRKDRNKADQTMAILEETEKEMQLHDRITDLESKLAKQTEKAKTLEAILKEENGRSARVHEYQLKIEEQAWKLQRLQAKLDEQEEIFENEKLEMRLPLESKIKQAMIELDKASEHHKFDTRESEKLRDGLVSEIHRLETKLYDRPVPGDVVTILIAASGRVADDWQMTKRALQNIIDYILSRSTTIKVGIVVHSTDTGAKIVSPHETVHIGMKAALDGMSPTGDEVWREGIKTAVDMVEGFTKQKRSDTEPYCWYGQFILIGNGRMEVELYSYKDVLTLFKIHSLPRILSIKFHVILTQKNPNSPLHDLVKQTGGRVFCMSDEIDYNRMILGGLRYEKYPIRKPEEILSDCKSKLKGSG